MIIRDNEGRFMKGIYTGYGFKKGRITWNKGKEGLKGNKNPAWQGGKSFEPYGREFNDRLKNQIRQRDNYRCQECFRHQDELRSKSNRLYKLLIHHIDFNKKNNNADNLISLCRNFHLQTNWDREKWIDYYQKKVIGGHILGAVI